MSVSGSSVPRARSYVSPGWSDERSGGRRATLGHELDETESPKRGGPNRRAHSQIGSPFQGFDAFALSTQGCATFVSLTSLHPGLA